MSAALSVALLAGLCRGAKWACILTMALAVAGVVVSFSQGSCARPTALALDSVVVVPVLVCRDFYFPFQAAPA